MTTEQYKYEMVSGKVSRHKIAEKMTTEQAALFGRKWLETLPLGGVYRLKAYRVDDTEGRLVMQIIIFPESAIMRKTVSNGKRFYYVNRKRVSGRIFKSVCEVLRKRSYYKEAVTKHGKKTTSFMASK